MTKFVFQKDHSGCIVRDRMETIWNRFTETGDFVIWNWHRIYIMYPMLGSPQYKASTLPRDWRWAPPRYNIDLFKSPLCQCTRSPRYKLASWMQSVALAPGFPFSWCITWASFLCTFPFTFKGCSQVLFSFPEMWDWFYAVAIRVIPHLGSHLLGLCACLSGTSSIY